MTTHSEQGNRLQKRQRVTRACDPCRRGKLRCDGREPRCSTCIQTKRKCRYGPESKRRGLRTGYVRAIECLWGLALQEIDGLEDVMDDLLENATTRAVFTRSDRADAENGASALSEKWKASFVAQRLDALLDSANGMDEDDDAVDMSNPDAHFLNATSSKWMVVSKQSPGNDFDSLTSSQPEQIPSSTQDAHIAGYDNVINTQTQFQTSSSINQAPPSTIETKALLPDHSHKLLQALFAFNQAWFPIIDRHIVLKSFFLYQNDPKVLSNADTAALWGALAFSASFYPKFEGIVNGEDIITPKDLHIQAESMFHLYSDDVFDIGHVQCLLFLALSKIRLQKFESACRITRQAHLLTQELADDQSTSDENDIITRLRLGCFILDTLCSTFLRRTPFIQLHDVERDFTIKDTGPEEWQMWQPCNLASSSFANTDGLGQGPTRSLSIFNLLTELVLCLNDFLRDLKEGQSTYTYLKTLENWRQKASSHLSQAFGTVAGKSDSRLSGMPSGVVNLHITYNFVLTIFTSHVQPQQSLGTKGSSDLWPFQNIKIYIQQDPDLSRQLPMSFLISSGTFGSNDRSVDSQRQRNFESTRNHTTQPSSHHNISTALRSGARNVRHRVKPFIQSSSTLETRRFDDAETNSNPGQVPGFSNVRNTFDEMLINQNPMLSNQAQATDFLDLELLDTRPFEESFQSSSVPGIIHPATFDETGGTDIDHFRKSLGYSF